MLYAICSLLLLLHAHYSEISAAQPCKLNSNIGSFGSFLYGSSPDKILFRNMQGSIDDEVKYLYFNQSRQCQTITGVNRVNTIDINK